MISGRGPAGNRTQKKQSGGCRGIGIGVPEHRILKARDPLGPGLRGGLFFVGLFFFCERVSNDFWMGQFVFSLLGRPVFLDLFFSASE